MLMSNFESLQIPDHIKDKFPMKDSDTLISPEMLKIANDSVDCLILKGRISKEQRSEVLKSMLPASLEESEKLFAHAGKNLRG